MDQTNARIFLDPANLGVPCRKMAARCGMDFVAELQGVPDDVSDVTVRVCPVMANGAFYEFPASRSDAGYWRCRILGAALSSEAVGWYEVRAVSAAGNATALGRGRLDVHPFSAGVAVPVDSRRRAVMAIPDENGGMHAIYAVRDDAGAWSFVIGDIDDPATVGAQMVSVGAVSAGEKPVRVVADGETVRIEDVV